MSDTAPSSLWKAALIPLAALCVGAGLAYLLAGMGRGAVIKFGDSGMEINLPADESFAGVLDRALLANGDDPEAGRRAIAAVRDLEARDFYRLQGELPDRTQLALQRLGYFRLDSEALRLRSIFDLTADELPPEAVQLLQRKGYYHYTSPALVARLEKDAPQEVVRGLRELLWEGRGPFRPPEAYRGAGAKLAEAINQLAVIAQNQGEVLEVYERLFLDYLEERGIFRTPDLVGILKPMRFGNPNDRLFYPCENAKLPVGVSIIIQHDGGWIDGRVGGALRDPDICAGAPDTGEMLAGAPLPIGFHPSAFGVAAETLNTGGEVVAFVLYPREMTVAMSPEVQ